MGVLCTQGLHTDWITEEPEPVELEAHSSDQENTAPSGVDSQASKASAGTNPSEAEKRVNALRLTVY